MAVSYMTSSSLIADIKRRAMIPTNQKTFQDVDFLSLANDEIDIGLTPSIMIVHEEFFVTSEDVTIVSNQSHYPIPYRAIGGKLRDVFYKDIQGNIREMSRISPDDRAFYQTASLQNFFGYFYIEGNDIVLIPSVSSAGVGSIVFTYWLRPNDLVTEDRVATIQSIAVDSNAGTTTYTVDQVPNGFAPSVAFDLMQARPGHQIRRFDVQATVVSPTNKMITFNTVDTVDFGEVTSAIRPGDYISFAGECIIPGIPSELHTVLAQRTACRCLEALGDQAGLQAANQKLAEMEQKTATLIDNRVEGAPQKINNFRGLLRSSKLRRRGWF